MRNKTVLFFILLASVGTYNLHSAIEKQHDGFLYKIQEWSKNSTQKRSHNRKINYLRDTFPSKQDTSPSLNNTIYNSPEDSMSPDNPLAPEQKSKLQTPVNKPFPPFDETRIPVPPGVKPYSPTILPIEFQPGGSTSPLPNYNIQKSREKLFVPPGVNPW